MVGSHSQELHHAWRHGEQAVDQGYGLVCDGPGALIEGLLVTAANREHVIISARPGSAATIPELPIGTRLHILPNHAYATAAQHDRYHVIPAASGPVEEWSRFAGW